MTTLADVLAYDPSKVKPGWIAFFLVMALIAATFLLWRSMNTQLGKIRVPHRASFDDEPGGTRTDGGGQPDPAEADPPRPPDDESRPSSGQEV